MSGVPPPKILLDEDLSPHVAVRLCAEGIDATHVRNRASLGATDKDVLEIAYSEDRILVTANIGDFVKLARTSELHRGLILVEDGSLTRDEQYEVVSRALQTLAEASQDLINHVLRISEGNAGMIEPLFAPAKSEP